jgi:hypothetical protein
MTDTLPLRAANGYAVPLLSASAARTAALDRAFGSEASVAILVIREHVGRSKDAGD